jgi:hypothetical protein
MYELEVREEYADYTLISLFPESPPCMNTSTMPVDLILLVTKVGDEHISAVG